jgi:hypothetical protein
MHGVVLFFTSFPYSCVYVDLRGGEFRLSFLIRVLRYVLGNTEAWQISVSFFFWGACGFS